MRELLQSIGGTRTANETSADASLVERLATRENAHREVFGRAHCLLDQIGVLPAQQQAFEHWFAQLKVLLFTVG